MIGRKRLCRYLGCMRVAGENRYCDLHARSRQAADQPMKRKRLQRKTADRGYNESWRRMRKHFLRDPENVFCRECGGPATVVDHIIPHRGNRELFHDRSNWQPLCYSCHGKKSQSEMLNNG